MHTSSHLLNRPGDVHGFRWRSASPIAQNDSNIIAEDASIQVVAPGVLINDSDPKGGPLTITTAPVALPTHGTVVLSSNGAYTSTHDSSETTSNSFVYEVCDNEMLCDTATVSITVVPVNDPPNPINDSISVAEGSSASQSAPGVLGNDHDAEGDTLTVTTTPGTRLINPQ
ncbi:MAG: Ig-like domain-containing protein [Chloroflexota bacterium]